MSHLGLTSSMNWTGLNLNLSLVMGQEEEEEEEEEGLADFHNLEVGLEGQVEGDSFTSIIIITIIMIELKVEIDEVGGNSSSLNRLDTGLVYEAVVQVLASPSLLSRWKLQCSILQIHPKYNRVIIIGYCV